MELSFALEWWFNTLVISMLLLPIIMHFLQRRIVLSNDKTYMNKEIPYLYSWISLVFVFFVPLFRGDIRWFLMYLFSTLLTAGIANLILAYFYNRKYILNLLRNGYVPANEETEILLQLKNIKIS